MKVARFLVAAWCATETASAFAPSTSAGWCRRSGHRRPTDDLAMAPVDSSLMDPYSTPAIFLAGAGATFFAAFATFQKNKIDGKSNASTKKKSGGRSRAPAEQPRVDLSIPYDAVATLAYDAARAAESPSLSMSKKKVGFEAFRSLYEAQVVAEVTAKARIRDLNEEAEALRARLAALEWEIAGNGGDVASLNDEAAGFRAQIQELFR